jgi:hypothetical protein
MSDYEGLPVALLEAMACGVVPVVRNIRSGIPEIVHEGRTGLLLGDNIATGAEALVTLANSPDSWSRMSTAARDLVSRSYSQEICHKKWQELIHELQARSEARYPLPVPVFPSLPPLDPRLAAFDHRSYPWRKLIRLFARKVARVLRKSF